VPQHSKELQTAGARIAAARTAAGAVRTAARTAAGAVCATARTAACNQPTNHRHTSQSGACAATLRLISNLLYLLQHNAKHRTRVSAAFIYR
jgi:hypothetical protein